MTRLTELKPAPNPTESQWLPDRIERPWARGDQTNYVASVIPRGFADYVRIFHPPYDTLAKREASWTEVAGCYHRKAHGQMQWHAISKSGLEQPKYIEPDKGHLSEAQARALVRILMGYTETPDMCHFAVWDGWGMLGEQWPEAARLHLPGRSYILLDGPIEAAQGSMTPNFPQSASLWWPQDRAWCVATEIDMMWTYVGGTEFCIRAILADNSLEAYGANPDDRVDIKGDLLNLP